MVSREYLVIKGQQPQGAPKNKRNEARPTKEESYKSLLAWREAFEQDRRNRGIPENGLGR